MREFAFLSGGDEMGQRMREHDWSTSPLGDPSGWPQSLRSVVGLMLNSKFPMFVAWGNDLGFLYNDPYAAILGEKHPSALGRRFFDIWAEIWPDISPLIDAAMAGEATYREDLPLLMNRRGYDEQTYFTFSYSPLRDESGTVAGMFCACTETTRTVLAGRAISESEARFRNLADQSPMMVWVTEPDGSCTFLSRSWYEFTGQREEHALGFGWLEAVHPDDRAASGETFVQANAAQAPFKLEYRLRAADGTYRWAIDAASPLFGPQGQYLGYVGSVVDIHDQKKVEESLAQQVSEEVDRRVRAEQALIQSQKLETLGQLTGGVAHDFNNLLTPIVGALDLVQKSVGDDSRAARLVGGAVQAADRARVLVQRLLAFSRRQHLKPQAVDTAVLVEGIADLLRRSLGPQVDLHIDVARKSAPAHVDPNQLELALVNLAVNARDAMPDGGRLAISVSRDSVQGRDGLADGDYVRIDVADSGAGMDQATLDRATEPFFTTKDLGKGTGLGLSSVQGLALQSGGVLAIDSEVNRGTTVTLWLPISAEPVQIEEKPEFGRSPRAERKATILLVDDEPLVRHGIADMVAGLGYQVVEAASAGAALALLDQGMHFDAIITDHAMPGLTGTALAQILREQQPELPVLVVTGYAHVAADAAATCNIMSKPFREEELASRLHALIAGREAVAAK